MRYACIVEPQRLFVPPIQHRASTGEDVPSPSLDARPAQQYSTKHSSLMGYSCQAVYGLALGGKKRCFLKPHLTLGWAVAGKKLCFLNSRLRNYQVAILGYKTCPAFLGWAFAGKKLCFLNSRLTPYG